MIAADYSPACLHITGHHKLTLRTSTLAERNIKIASGHVVRLLVDGAEHERKVTAVREWGPFVDVEIPPINPRPTSVALITEP